MFLRNLLRKSRITRIIYDYTRHIYKHRICVVLEQLEDSIFKFIDYHNKEIRKLKNTFKGERCFIVCNGPSLTVEDLGKIKGEYCFTMNSVIKVLDRTDWSPMFYGIQDEFVYEKIADDVLKCNSKYIFVGSKIKKKRFDIPKNAIIFRNNCAGISPLNDNPPLKFSSDPSIVVYDGFSITYSLMQIACYLGFKDIYLIGCDCSYSINPEKQHFINSGHVDPSAFIIGAKQILAYKKAKEYCDRNGIRVYNATRGGALEVFPRVNIDQMSIKNKISSQ